MYRSIISLSKIAHQSSCGTITHSAKETRQQKEQLRWGWRRQKIGGVEQNFDKGSRGGGGVRLGLGNIVEVYVYWQKPVYSHIHSACVLYVAPSDRHIPVHSLKSNILTINIYIYIYKIPFSRVVHYHNVEWAEILS